MHLSRRITFPAAVRATGFGAGAPGWVRHFPSGDQSDFRASTSTRFEPGGTAAIWALSGRPDCQIAQKRAAARCRAGLLNQNIHPLRGNSITDPSARRKPSKGSPAILNSPMAVDQSIRQNASSPPLHKRFHRHLGRHFEDRRWHGHGHDPSTDRYGRPSGGPAPITRTFPCWDEMVSISDTYGKMRWGVASVAGRNTPLRGCRLPPRHGNPRCLHHP